MTRAVFNAHTSTIFKSLRILKVHDQITLPNCLFAHEFLNGKLPKSFENTFSKWNDVVSEHFSQFVFVKRERVDYKNIKRFQHDYSKFHAEQFRDEQNWNTNLNNANALFTDFHFKLKGCIDRHASIKQLTPKEVKLANKPRITPEISKMIKIRNNIFARKNRQPNNENIK